MGRLEKRAAEARGPDALYAIVGSLARAVDGVLDEIRENTAAVDGVCSLLKKIATKVGVE